MAYLDIILYAAIAAFVLARLWFVLGRRHDDEPQQPNPFATPVLPPLQDDEDMSPPNGQTPLPPPLTALPRYAPASLAGQVEQLRQADPSFDEKIMLQTARVAFITIVEAFGRGDVALLQDQLAPQVLADFTAAIASRRLSRAAPIEVVAITEAELTGAAVTPAQQQVTIRFTSEQRVAEAHDTVHDIWTFSRATATAPWLVTETRI